MSVWPQPGAVRAPGLAERAAVPPLPWGRCSVRPAPPPPSPPWAGPCPPRLLPPAARSGTDDLDPAHAVAGNEAVAAVERHVGRSRRVRARQRRVPQPPVGPRRPADPRAGELAGGDPLRRSLRPGPFERHPGARRAAAVDAGPDHHRLAPCASTSSAHAASWPRKAANRSIAVPIAAASSLQRVEMGLPCLRDRPASPASFHRLLRTGPASRHGRRGWRADRGPPPPPEPRAPPAAGRCRHKEPGSLCRVLRTSRRRRSSRRRPAAATPAGGAVRRVRAPVGEARRGPRHGTGPSPPLPPAPPPRRRSVSKASAASSRSSRADIRSSRPAIAPAMPVSLTAGCASTAGPFARQPVRHAAPAPVFRQAGHRAARRLCAARGLRVQRAPPLRQFPDQAVELVGRLALFFWRRMSSIRAVVMPAS